jgi:hypothetical protein
MYISTIPIILMPFDDIWEHEEAILGGSLSTEDEGLKSKY